MPLPLYGFLEGDTIGQLIVAEDGETVGSLTRKLQDAASIRVKPRGDVHLIYQEQVIDPALTISEAGLTALERFDVRERTHGFSKDRDRG